MSTPENSHDALPSLFDYYPQAIEGNAVKNVTDLHGDVVIAFLTDRPNYKGRLQIIGSGFLVFSSDPNIVCVVTAAHVRDDFIREEKRYLAIAGQIVMIGDIGRWSIFQKSDITFWEIHSTHFVRCGITDLPTLPLLNAEIARKEYSPTSSFVIFGYPGTRNDSIDIRPGRNANKCLYGMALHRYEYSVESNELFFNYSERKVTAEKWAPPLTTAPHLKAMSGSPCMRIIVSKSLKRLSLCLSGVFTHWKKSEHKLRAYQLGDPWFDEVQIKQVSPSHRK